MIAKLKAELADPKYAAMSDIDAADAINAKAIDVVRPIESRMLLVWAGSNQRLKKIEEAATVHVSGDVQNVAKIVLPMLSRSDTSLDMSLDSHKTLVSVLIAGGVLSAGDDAELTAMATKQVSRSSQIGLGTVKPGHVQKARA